MSESESSRGSVKSQQIEVDSETLRRIRERVLQAEKEKLNLDLPRGINNEIQRIIEEEIQ